MQSYKNDRTLLATRLGLMEDELLALVANAPKHYRPFHLTIVKPNGTRKTRHIDNPHKRYSLRAVQKRINNELLIPEIPTLDDALVGGIKKRSMLKHIEPHIGKKTVVCMDLSNCFPNISYKRVVAAWKRLGYSDQLAKLLAKLTTFRGYLPQGAPTSSLLCNFALNPMAVELHKLMAAHGIDYTQYIDDICFSGNDDTQVRAMINEVYRIAGRYEQHIKRKKTEIMDSKRRQQLMRITINVKTKIDGDVMAKIIAIIGSLPKDGVIDRNTSLSITGHILHVRKFDGKAAAYLERTFNAKVKKVYESDERSKQDGVVEPCDDYRKDGTRRAKCQYLVD